MLLSRRQIKRPFIVSFSLYRDRKIDHSALYTGQRLFFPDGNVCIHGFFLQVIFQFPYRALAETAIFQKQLSRDA